MGEGDLGVRAPVAYWRADQDERRGEVVHVSVFRVGDRVLARVAWPSLGGIESPRLDAVSVPHALLRARWLVERHGFEGLTVFVSEETPWQEDWGELHDRPTSPSVLKPLQPKGVQTQHVQPQVRFLGRFRK